MCLHAGTVHNNFSLRTNAPVATARQPARFGPVMWLGPNDKNTGRKLSPYGEWRWSPMGLAGRDPIFYAQMESEITILKQESKATTENVNAVVNLCLTCHGVMGKKQLDIDQGGANDTFQLDWIYDTAADRRPREIWHAGARIRCTVCRAYCARRDATGAKPFQLFPRTLDYGAIYLTPPTQINGPFKQVSFAR